MLYVCSWTFWNALRNIASAIQSLPDCSTDGKGDGDPEVVVKEWLCWYKYLHFILFLLFKARNIERRLIIFLGLRYYFRRTYKCINICIVEGLGSWCYSSEQTLPIWWAYSGYQETPLSYLTPLLVQIQYCGKPPGGGPRVVVSTAAFHARVRGSVPGLGGLKETKQCFFPIHVWKSVLWGASVTER